MSTLDEGTTAQLEAALAEAREDARQAREECERLRAALAETSRAVPVVQRDDTLESQALLRGVLASATSGIVVVKAVRDPSGAIVDFLFTLVNPMSEKLLGLSAEALLGQSMVTLFPGAVESTLFGMYAAVTESGVPQETEAYYHDDRLAFWLNVSAVRVGDGAALTFTDITGRKRAEQELLDRSNQLASQKAFAEYIIENDTTGICYLDRDLVYRMANPVLCGFLQMPRERIVGWHISEVVPGGEVTLMPMLRRVLDHGEVVQFQSLPLTYRMPDGTERQSYWDASYLPMHGPSGVEGVLVLASEVSDRIENERLQAEHISSLERANVHKEQFLSILSHELRTPINAIMGFASILDDGVLGPMSADQQTYLGRILDGAERLLALITDLLDMSRIQAGKFMISFGAVHLDQVCQDAIATLQPLVAQRRLQVTYADDGLLPPVQADSQRIEQVMLNLLSNAIKFTAPGGTVGVAVRTDGAGVRVEVTDTGIGIPHDEQRRIFDAFTQVDMSNTRMAGGTGLGLSITKALVEAHGGDIGVTSEPGVGSTFWFSLPLTR